VGDIGVVAMVDAAADAVVIVVLVLSSWEGVGVVVLTADVGAMCSSAGALLVGGIVLVATVAAAGAMVVVGCCSPRGRASSW